MSAGAKPEEIAWLVEGRANGHAVWWTGKWSVTPYRLDPLRYPMRSTDDMEPVFSDDHMAAIRFARRQDAERAIGLLPPIYQKIVTASEHIWLGASPRRPA